MLTTIVLRGRVTTFDCHMWGISFLCYQDGFQRKMAGLQITCATQASTLYWLINNLMSLIAHAHLVRKTSYWSALKST